MKKIKLLTCHMWLQGFNWNKIYFIRTLFHGVQWHKKCHCKQGKCASFEGQEGGGDLQRDVRWEDRPASTPAVTQTTVVIYDRRLHTFSTMKFTILAIDNWIWPKVQVYHIQQILFNTFFYNEEVAIIKRKYNSTLCIVYVANF